MRESTYLVFLLTLTKVYGQPPFRFTGSASLPLWASTSRSLSRKNSSLGMGLARSNSGLSSPFNSLSGLPSMFELGSGTGTDFNSKPTKEYEEEDGLGGKTIVKEFGTPGSNSYGRQITRTSGFPSRLGSTTINDPVKDANSPPSPPSTGFGSGFYRRFGSFDSYSPLTPSLSPSPSGRGLVRSFSFPKPGTDSSDTNPKPQAPPTPAQPSLTPPPSRRWSSFQPPSSVPESDSLNNYPKPATPPTPAAPAQPSLAPSLSRRWPSFQPPSSVPANGSFNDPKPAASPAPSPPAPQPAQTPTPSPSPYGYGRTGSTKREDPLPSPANNGYSRTPSFPPSKNSSGTITINDETPDGRKITIRINVGRITDEEESNIKRHVRNTITILYYFPTWKCAIVSRLQPASG